MKSKKEDDHTKCASLAREKTRTIPTKRKQRKMDLPFTATAVNA